MAAHRPYRLPNGLTVHGLCALDTGLVYRDIFEEGYARHGVTVRDGDCVFDVGANTGLFLVYLNQVCGNGILARTSRSVYPPMRLYNGFASS